MPKKQSLINLLPKEEFERSTTGRVLKWAMTTFRYIVIVTEMIVMGAFLSRFWLDARNADLGDSIKVASARIEAQSDFEQEFRNTQTQLSVFSQIDKGLKPSEIINKIISWLPSGLTLSSVTFHDTYAEVKGVAGNEVEVAQLIANLKSDKSFSSITQGQLLSSQSDQNLTIFNLEVNY